MTISILHTTGNGYSCGCCRHTDTDELFVDSEADALAECIDIAESADWDFSIDRILFLDGTPEDDGLKARLKAGIKLAEQAQKLNKKIQQAADGMRDIDTWFATLAEQQAQKQASRQRLAEDLARLQQELVALEAPGVNP